MTANVIAMITSRPGKGAPVAVEVGIAAASTSDAAPRRPVQETSAGSCHGGGRARRRPRALNPPGRKGTGDNHTKRPPGTRTPPPTAPPPPGPAQGDRQPP